MPYFKDLSVCAYHSTGLKLTFCLSNVNTELSADEQTHTNHAEGKRRDRKPYKDWEASTSNQHSFKSWILTSEQIFETDLGLSNAHRGTHFTSHWSTLTNSSTEQVQVTHGLTCGEVWEALPEEESVQRVGVTHGLRCGEVWEALLRKRVYRGEFRWLTAWGVVRCERPCWERECTEESSGDSRPEVWWGVRGLAEKESVQRRVQVTHGLRCGEVWEALLRKRVYRGEFKWLTAWGVVRCERPCWERECTEESSGDSRPEVWWGVRGPARGREHTAGGRSPGEQPGGTGRPAGCHWGLAVPSGRSSPCTSPGNPAMIGENDVITLHYVPAQETLQWLVKMMSSLFIMYQPRKPRNDWWKWCHHSSLCTSPGNPAMIGENDVITLHYVPAQETLQWLVKMMSSFFTIFQLRKASGKQWCHHSSLCTSPGNPAIVGENDVIILYHLPAQESQWKTMSYHTVSLHFAADVKHTTLHKANIFNRQTCNQ